MENENKPTPYDDTHNINTVCNFRKMAIIIIEAYTESRRQQTAQPQTFFELQKHFICIEWSFSGHFYGQCLSLSSFFFTLDWRKTQIKQEKEADESTIF